MLPGHPLADDVTAHAFMRAYVEPNRPKVKIAALDPGPSAGRLGHQPPARALGGAAPGRAARDRPAPPPPPPHSPAIFASPTRS